MNKFQAKKAGLERRKRRVRGKVTGTADRPRLAVHRTNAHIYAQVIDDVDGKTICAASTLDPEFRATGKLGSNKEAAAFVGELVGKQDEAASVVESMQKTFDEIKANAGDGSKTVYFEVSPLEYGLWTAGANTFMNEIAELLGLKNCFADVEGWAEISEEQVLERNPDYIMTISMYFGEGPTPEEEIASRAGWENVTAVKNGAILNLQNNELSRPAPRLAEGAQMLADFIAGVEANDKAA